MPFGLGWPELIIVLVIVLVIFGASRLADIGGSLGKGIREFKKGATGEDEKKPEAASEPKTEAKG
ncbi:MAG: twin-arginine translocase TatA/TatE family subunit [SAR202 cluster bacterium]|nr:twin-arginine translocase TatA/TatE family subunit [SAR202 cluster bacterium]